MSMPATLQERWFGRMFLLLPLVIAVLSSFWLASGLIALVDLDRAVAELGWLGSKEASQFLVASAAGVDILLGL